MEGVLEMAAYASCEGDLEVLVGISSWVHGNFLSSLCELLGAPGRKAYRGYNYRLLSSLEVGRVYARSCYTWNWSIPLCDLHLGFEHGCLRVF